MFGHNAFVWTPVNVLHAEAAWDYDGPYHSIAPANAAYNSWSNITYSDGSFGGSFETAESAVSFLETTMHNPDPDLPYRIEGFDTNTDPNFDKKSGNTNSPTTNPNPKDCPSENREDGADDTECGDCLSDFTEDATGVCVKAINEKEDTDWLMIGGGIAAVAVIGYFVMNK